jgi:hypothetical protein
MNFFIEEGEMVQDPIRLSIPINLLTEVLASLTLREKY